MAARSAQKGQVLFKCPTAEHRKHLPSRLYSLVFSSASQLLTSFGRSSGLGSGLPSNRLGKSDRSEVYSTPVGVMDRLVSLTMGTGNVEGVCT